MKELLEQFPKEGWFRIVRSPTNNYKWWCNYEPLTTNEPLKLINEAWGDTPEEAMKKVLERLKLNGIIE